jgi:hypothetical protein
MPFDIALRAMFYRAIYLQETMDLEWHKTIDWVVDGGGEVGRKNQEEKRKVAKKEDSHRRIRTTYASNHQKKKKKSSGAVPPTSLTSVPRSAKGGYPQGTTCHLAVCLLQADS